MSHKYNSKNNSSLDVTISNEYICSSCNSNSMIEDTSQGLIICNSCGQVQDGVYFNGPDKINYEDNEKPNTSRFSMPVNLLLPESSIYHSTIIGNGLSKIIEIQKWGSIYKENALRTIYNKLESICYKNNILKSIEDDAKILFKKISECCHQTGKNKGKVIITRGNNRESIIAACLYNACMKNKMSKVPKEIAKMFKISVTDMNSGCNKFDEMINSNNLQHICDTSHTQKPYYYIKNACNNSKISMDDSHIEKAIEISKNIDKLDLITTHIPHSIAVVSVLLMAEHNKLNGLTKKKIASLFDIKDITLTRIYKKIEKYKEIVVDTNKTNELYDSVKKDIINIPVSVYERMKKFNTYNKILCDNIQYKITVILNKMIDNLINNIEFDIKLYNELNELKNIQYIIN